MSIHLTVVLIGAAYLARAKRRPKERDMIGLNHYLVLGALLFTCGVICMAVKRRTPSAY